MQPYRERVWPGPMPWCAAGVVTTGLGLVALPLGTPTALVTAAVVGAAMVAGLVAWTPRLEADAAGLRVGDEVLAAEEIAEVAVLDAEQMRRLRGPQLDARTRTVLRPGPPGGVHVRAREGSWLVSCRRPEELRAALRR